MRATTGVLIAVALMIGGCSGDSKPESEPTTSPSVPTTEPATPTPEPTPDVTMPVVEPPDDAPMYAEFSEEAALEFLDYYWEVYSYFQATKDTEAWHAVSDPECIFCSNMHDVVQEQQEYLFGIEVQVVDVLLKSIDDEIRVIELTGGMQESAASMFAADGTYLREIPADEEPEDRTFYLLHEDGRWQMWEVL